jgi:hypothetical protein
LSGCATRCRSIHQCLWLVLLAFVMLGEVAHADAPRIEFATREAVGRGVHPVRLTVDTAGPRRESPLRLDAPRGSRFMQQPPATIAEGEGATAVHVLHLLVLPEAPAGELVLKGTLGTSPLAARLAVRGLPDFEVIGAPRDTLLGFGGAGVNASLVVRNRGNTALAFRVHSQTGTSGPRVVIAEEAFELPVGGEREVTIAIHPPDGSRISTEHSVAVLFEGRADKFDRTAPAIINTLFVPDNPDPGPLFAELSGSAEIGVQVADGRGTLASRLRLSGEISPGVTLDAHALDGATDVLGSQLGLAGRDTWHVRLEAARWHATAGEARAPSLGFLAPGAYGRGFAAGVRKQSWSADAFALRDRFTSSVREAAGVRMAGPGESWEAGAILQRSRDATFAREDRAGVFGGLHWKLGGIDGHTQIALAGSEGESVKPGFAQTLAHHGERLRIDAQFEHAESGFFLRDQSSERQSLNVEWSAGRSWTILAGADRSEQTGRLRTLLQERDNTGQPDDPPDVIELINEVATRQETYHAGFRREFARGSLRAGYRRQERAGELDVLREFVEDAFEAEWTSRPVNPWWRLGATVGREAGDGSSADFAEVRSSLQWSPTPRSRVEGTVRWTEALSGEPQGFRREGVHGQLTASLTPAKDWRAEVRVEGYDYADFEPRTRLGALLRFPIGKRGWSGAVEWVRDTQRGDESAWFVLRAPLAFEMPWRPLRGAISGRIVDAATGAGLPSVLVQSGRHRAVSDSSGRYQLPAMDPGGHEIALQTPTGWTAPSTAPKTVTVVAGRRDSLDIALVELGTLHGEIRITAPDGAGRTVPAGVIVAEGSDGSVHETLAYRGSFTMRLPPGVYRVKFVSELPDAVARQLHGEVTVRGAAEPTTVRLKAIEETRRIRRTLAPGVTVNPGGN